MIDLAIALACPALAMLGIGLAFVIDRHGGDR